MNFSDPKSRQDAWEFATPLREFIEKRAARQCRESIPGWPSNWTPQDASRGAHWRLQNWKAAQNTAQAFTLQDLIRGQLVALGRMSDSNAIEFVSEVFWDGADFKWQTETARGRDGRAVSEIRIVDEMSAEPDRHRGRSSSAPSKRKSKKTKGYARRPSRKKPPKKLGGRPKSRDEILVKYHELCESRPAFHSLNVKKEMAPEIRVAIRGEGQRDVQTRGYSDAHIAKIVGQERARVRKQSKRTKPTKPT